ncbi:DUF7737 domain-containing protein [Catenuloplanes atrovinosus]|uniref:DUF7737 domain-containing protein n=1 Tax=Catenuloplanes atrovinosus TaxID=137266 RepID=A0AAE3YV25_9ACTN|nr:hypothetical protein [Catenuloplanes atrovinosus]MDR7279152.1 hypothetical protein [Catenuloplanes atrovinosus]
MRLGAGRCGRAPARRGWRSPAGARRPRSSWRCAATRTRTGIHHSSGNILIAPEDRCLCIIPESAEPDLLLPFEGDSRLSEIISKALLLAADEKIKYPVILRQL